jgi:predicted CxxxxCH...CXXCH cytochrome family protein
VSAGDNRAITDRTAHANGAKDLQFIKDPEGIASWVNPTCSNVYCHSTGRTAGDVPTGQLPVEYSNNSHYRDMTWGDGIDLKCNGCHGLSNDYGFPDYSQVGGAGGLDANTHQQHVEGKDINCSACHNLTTSDGKSIISSSLHLNEVRNVVIAGAYDTNGVTDNYDTGTKTCSGISCHDAGSPSFTPIWGDTLAGDCTDCHAFPPATGAHATHVQSSALLTKAYGNAELKSNSGNYAFGCGTCHPSDPAMHQNMMVDIDLAPVDSGSGPLKSMFGLTPSYSQNEGVSVTCSSVYCHSSGFNDGTGFDYQTTPDWYGGSISGNCNDCHDNSPTSLGKAGTATHLKHVVGIHYDSIYTGTSGKATAGTGVTSSHGNPTSSTTINCNTCHFQTITVDYNDRNQTCTTNCHLNGVGAQGDAAIASKLTHVNGSVDVQFNAINVISKAQIRVNDSTVPEVNDVWSRTNGYKSQVSASYDTAINALNTGTMYDADSKTCTVTCHNSRSSTWGESNVDCFYCHSGLPETP